VLNYELISYEATYENSVSVDTCPVLAVNELKSETNSESFHEQKQFTDLYAVVPGGNITRGQSNLTKSASRGAHSPVRGHPRGSKFVPLNSWGRVSY